MGKGTDKLYLTHSEVADAYNNSLVNKPSSIGASFKRLPFNFCALSLQPFQHPVCTSEGIIFDLTQILPWLKKHGTNPVSGAPLKSSELIKLIFAKNDDDEYVDPVTYKAFTDNSHIVALKASGNVFSWDTVERLNIKAKNWRDLVTDEEFTRKDVITLQDPQNLEGRDLNAFKYLKDGVSVLTEEQERERRDPTNNLNVAAMGSAAKILKAKEAVAKAREERANAQNPNRSLSSSGVKGVVSNSTTTRNNTGTSTMPPPKQTPYNAAQHTTGKAAASFTSTGLTPHTSNALALLSDEDYMLKPKRVEEKGYARILTTQGTLNIELQTEHAPRAVWNFVQLAKRGYYKNIAFHRNIRNFMIQGGDPTGTGRGGTSCWGKPFADEYGHSPLMHDARGVLSMANKGKNTNTSQFFITYREATHLNHKHTIFGKVVDSGSDSESDATLKRLENVKTDKDDRPEEDCRIEDVVVFVDPFEEFQKNKAEKEGKEREEQEIQRMGGTEDDNTTWTGKRLRKDVLSGGGVGADAVGIGKYLAVAGSGDKEFEEVVEVEEWEGVTEEPKTKKRKTGGFGNFDAW